jgi:ATP-dependent Clp protease ATP-binding subunit ClpA
MAASAREHLLLGILQADPNAIVRFIPPNKIEEIRAEVEKGIFVNAPIPSHIDVPLSSEGERIHTFALAEADTWGHRHVDIGHLIAAVLREENGKAGQILRSAGLSLEAVRQQLSLDEAETVACCFADRARSACAPPKA